MFLELTIYLTGEKIMINIKDVSAIYANEEKKKTYILVGGTVFTVEESYKDIIKAIQNYSQLVDA